MHNSDTVDRRSDGQRIWPFWRIFPDCGTLLLTQESTTAQTGCLPYRVQHSARQPISRRARRPVTCTD